MKVVGIDVSSHTITLVISRDERAGKPRELQNTSQGHVTTEQPLGQANVSRVCLEAAGLYHLDLALALDDAGLEVMVIHPKAAKRFAEAMQIRTKTDASILPSWPSLPTACPSSHGAPPTLALSIRACARRIAALNKLRTQTRKPTPCRAANRCDPPLPDR